MERRENTHTHKHLIHRIKKIPTDKLIGQPGPHNPSLRPFYKVILDCVKLAIKKNHHGDLALGLLAYHHILSSHM